MSHFSKTINYTNAANFTFDSSKIEVGVSGATLVDGSDVNETFAATYASDQNGDRGNGTLTGTLNNGASVSGGSLVLNTGGDVDYVGTNKINHRIGSIRMNITPNYTGNPGAIQKFFDFAETSAVSRDRLTISQQTNGDIRAFYWDTSGVAQSFTTFGDPSFTASTQYELLFTWNFTPGSEAVRIFVDGVQLGSTDNKVLTSADDNTAVGWFNIGGGQGTSGATDFDVQDFAIYSNEVFTSNYTPGWTADQYASDSPNILVNETTSLDSLESFTESVTVASGNSVTYSLLFAGSDYYWNGSAWAVSSGSGQTSSAADINTNASSFPASAGGNFQIRAYLNSDGASAPALASNSFDYGPYFSQSSPTVCEVYGYLTDEKGDADPGATIAFRSQGAVTVGGNVAQINTGAVSVNASGYFGVPMIETTTDSVLVKCTVTYSDASIQEFNIRVPASASASIETIRV